MGWCVWHFQGVSWADSQEFRVALLEHLAGECQVAESPNRPSPEPCFTLFRHTMKQADKEHEFIQIHSKTEIKLLYWLIGWASVKSKKKHHRSNNDVHRLHADLEIEWKVTFRSFVNRSDNSDAMGTSRLMGFSVDVWQHLLSVRRIVAPLTIHSSRDR